MQNSKFTPISADDYGRSDMQINFQGFVFDIIPGATVAFDYKIIDDHIFDGCDVSVVGPSVKGDYLMAQIVDVDGVVAPPGTILNTFSPKWHVVPALAKQLEMNSRYPAKIPHGLYIRISYASLGASDAYVVVNCKLHRILW